MANTGELKSPITGKWILVDGRMVEDENCKIIQSLIVNRLKFCGRDKSGWDSAYLDPETGDVWELLYLSSHLQGGGPPTLQLVEKNHAREKYSLS
jgi:hypothetical protein